MSSETGLNTPQSSSSSSSSNRLPFTPYSPPDEPVYNPHDALQIDNQSSQKHSQPDTLHEPSAPPYSQQPTSADQEVSSAPIDDPIQQQILAAEQDPNSAPIDDDDNISLAAPIYDPTAVAAPYLTYVQEPAIEHVDTSRTHKNRIARIAFIVQLAFFLCVTIYAIVIWSIDYFSDRQNELMPGVMKSMAPVLLYAPLMMAFVNR